MRLVLLILAWLASTAVFDLRHPLIGWQDILWFSLYGILFLAPIIYTRALAVGSVILLSAIASKYLASIGFELWMMEGFFPWAWLELIARAYNATGEWAYELIELEMFLALHAAITLTGIALAALAIYVRRQLAEKIRLRLGHS